MIERVLLEVKSHETADRAGRPGPPCLCESKDETEPSAEHILEIVERLSRDLPGVLVAIGGPPVTSEVRVRISAWRHRDADLFLFDERVRTAAREGPFTLRIDAADEPPFESAVAEILTRYQRFLPRRNAASKTPLFDRTLAGHRALYDVTKPLVSADYDHALDTWQWVLRLDRTAGAPVQLAALFHDIERLRTEADERVEHRAADYQSFKDAHARTGAELTGAALRSIGWSAEAIRRSQALVAKHERPGDDPDLLLLNDADALSFFSLNSWGYLRYFGARQTARKIAYTLHRMRPSACARLYPVRYHPEVERMLGEALAEGAAA